MILPDALSILGHTISSQALFVEPQKILKVDNWSTLTKRTELQGFMGIVNYLSTYVPHLATVAAPLTRLCGDTFKFKWEPIHDVSLQQVKDIITAEAILKPINYDSTHQIFLITDASVKGIGAWIGQGPYIRDIQTAAFYSRKFKPAELNYNVAEKETLAIIDRLCHFHPQLMEPSS